MMRAFSSLSAPVSLRSVSASAAGEEDAPLSEEQPAAARSSAASAAATIRTTGALTPLGSIVGAIEDFDIRRVGDADCRPAARFHHSPHQHALPHQAVHV